MLVEVHFFMEEKYFIGFENSTFNQGEYAKNKMQEIELMNLEMIENTEEHKELKL